jgi:hypothetical protein
MSHPTYKCLTSTFLNNVGLTHLTLVPFKFDSFNSLWSASSGSIFSHIHLHCRCCCSRGRLTTFVRKNFDIRNWSNSLSNHRLWYHCWRKSMIIHIELKTTIQVSYAPYFYPNPYRTKFIDSLTYKIFKSF